MYGGYFLTHDDLWPWALRSVDPAKASTMKTIEDHARSLEYETYRIVKAEIEMIFNRDLLLIREPDHANLLKPLEYMLATSEKYYAKEADRPVDPVDGQSEDEMRVKKFLWEQGGCGTDSVWIQYAYFSYCGIHS